MFSWNSKVQVKLCQEAKLKQAVHGYRKRGSQTSYPVFPTLPLFTTLITGRGSYLLRLPDIVSSSVVKGIVETLGISMEGTAGLK